MGRVFCDASPFTEDSYTSSAHIKANYLALAARLQEKVSHDTWCYVKVVKSTRFDMTHETILLLH